MQIVTGERKQLLPAERVIVSADFKPDPTVPSGRQRYHIRKRVLTLADDLSRTGVTLKVNTALWFYGCELIRDIHSRGLGVFADLKLFDTPHTLELGGLLLDAEEENRPEFLTVACAAEVSAMRTLKGALKDTDTKILGVTSLSSMPASRFSVLPNARLAQEAGLDGIIASGQQMIRMLRINLKNAGDNMLIAAPGIRPEGCWVPSDDQDPTRVLKPKEALEAGADYIIVGRPITDSRDPYSATMRIIDEMAPVEVA